MSSCPQHAALAPAFPASQLLTANQLLAALPEIERRHLSVSLELVSLQPGQALGGAGQSSTHVYFPLDCLVSLVYATQDGGTAEVAVIGSEGMVGFGMFIGGSSHSSEALVQCRGSAYRIKLSLLKEYFNRSAALRDVLMQYMQALLTQSSQTALCNRHHTVEQQLCRWLLAAADRLRTNELEITQESIANTLGVRRAGITEAACRLQKDGLIRYRRGQVELLDRPRLERRACECYGVLRKEWQRLQPAAVAAPLPTRHVRLVAVRSDSMPQPIPAGANSPDIDSLSNRNA